MPLTHLHDASGDGRGPLQERLQSLPPPCLSDPPHVDDLTGRTSPCPLDAHLALFAGSRIVAGSRTTGELDARPNIRSTSAIDGARSRPAWSQRRWVIRGTAGLLILLRIEPQPTAGILLQLRHRIFDSSFGCPAWMREICADPCCEGRM